MRSSNNSLVSPGLPRFYRPRFPGGGLDPRSTVIALYRESWHEFQSGAVNAGVLSPRWTYSSPTSGLTVDSAGGYLVGNQMSFSGPLYTTAQTNVDTTQAYTVAFAFQWVTTAAANNNFTLDISLEGSSNGQTDPTCPQIILGCSGSTYTGTLYNNAAQPFDNTVVPAATDVIVRCDYGANGSNGAGGRTGKLTVNGVTILSATNLANAVTGNRRFQFNISGAGVNPTWKLGGISVFGQHV